MRLRYVLIGDGPSDDVLHQPILWTLRRLRPDLVVGESPFLPRRHRPPGDVIEEAVRIHAPQLILVHREAEKEAPEHRRREIPTMAGVVAIIPVRMTEAWLLIDEAAIRTAVNRPRGKEPLRLPPLSTLEHRPDPKADLEEALFLAAGSPGGRNKKRLESTLPSLKRRVAEGISSFEPLLQLSAFRRWHDDLEAALHQLP